jgi:hypothetical protein
MNLLYVTTFSPDLYEATGKKLLASMEKHGIEDPILVCHEGFPAWDRPPSYRLDDDEYLRTWLKANRDIIPVHLGGLTQICKCRDAHVRHSQYHVKGCPWHWMNRNASRWFRKVAALRHVALDEAYRDVDAVVWLDSDCHFVKPVTQKHVKGWFSGHDIFYFRGKREAPEVGIWGLNFRTTGRAFIAEVCQRYEGEFRNDHRWDDGFQIGRVLDTGTYHARDLVTKHENNNVMWTVPEMWNFIQHVKGSHGRILGIMK